MKKEFKSFDELCGVICEYCGDNCAYCPIQYGIDNNFKIEGVFDNKQTIEVKKIYFLGINNKMYYWYITKNTEDEVMPDKLIKNIKKFEIDPYDEYIRTYWFEIEKDKIKLLTLYDEQGNIVE